MVFASIREHAEHRDFFASTSRDKEFALRAESSLESTTREQRAPLVFSACSNPYRNPFLKNKTANILERSFNSEPAKCFEAIVCETPYRDLTNYSRV